MFANFNMYEGELVNWQRQGEGYFVYFDGSVFEGDRSLSQTGRQSSNVQVVLLLLAQYVILQITEQEAGHTWELRVLWNGCIHAKKRWRSLEVMLVEVFVARCCCTQFHYKCFRWFER